MERLNADTLEKLTTSLGNLFRTLITRFMKNSDLSDNETRWAQSEENTDFWLFFYP